MCPQLAGAQSFVTLEGRQFMLDGNEFYPRVMNYSVQIACNTMNDNAPDDLYLSPGREYDSNIEGHFEWNDETHLLNQLHDHFLKIQSMGFNTIRLIGMGALMHRDISTGAMRYSIEVNYNGTQSIPEPTRYLLDLDAPQFTGPLTDRFFDLLEMVLDEAQAEGLKVILLCADNYGDAAEQLTLASDQDAVDLYRDYLSRLAFRFQDHTALLGYDLWNEPIWTTNDYELMNWSKGDVCAFTSEWYDAIRDKDPHHLITLGGASFRELGVWDPEAMKLDFYSPHVYPFPSPVDAYDLPSAYARYKAELYWLGSACPIPWIIGETGFSAEDDVFDPLDDFTGPDNKHLDAVTAHHRMPWMNGSEQDQSDFATISMDATRNYLGSGYSWWAFQNSRSSNLQSEAKDYLGNWFAPLKFGNDAGLGLPAPWDVLHHWRDKVMVTTMENYVLPPTPASLPAPPSNYYNWFGLPDNNIAFEGYVNDEDGNPIPNAIAEVHWLYEFQGSPGIEDNYDLWDVAPTDGDGRFTIRTPYDIPMSIHPAVQGLSLNALDVLGVGFGDHIGSWSSTAFLAAAVAGATVDIDGESVTPGSHADWYAGHTLTVTNTTISSGNAFAYLHARHEVLVGPEFHAEAGSEVHLYISNECYPIAESPLNPEDKQILAGGIMKREQEVEPERMLLHFQVAEASIVAYPDPCTDRIHFTTDLDGPKVCTLLDSDGRLVFQGEMPGPELDITTTALGVGTYVVRITNGNKSRTTTFIKQP